MTALAVVDATQTWRFGHTGFNQYKGVLWPMQPWRRYELPLILGIVGPYKGCTYRGLCVADACGSVLGNVLWSLLHSVHGDKILVL